MNQVVRDAVNFYSLPVNCTSVGRAFTRGAHTGESSSGIGFATKIFRVCRAVNRAHDLAFFFRALSVEIPVPAYICRYSLDSMTKATRARRVGVHADRFQIAPNS